MKTIEIDGQQVQLSELGDRWYYVEDRGKLYGGHLRNAYRNHYVMVRWLGGSEASPLVRERRLFTQPFKSYDTAQDAFDRWVNKQEPFKYCCLYWSKRGVREAIANRPPTYAEYMLSRIAEVAT